MNAPAKLSGAEALALAAADPTFAERVTARANKLLSEGVRNPLRKAGVQVRDEIAESEGGDAS